MSTASLNVAVPVHRPSGLARWMTPTVALALLVLGVRLAVFWYGGSPLPYYDQWVAEFNNLYLQAVLEKPLIGALFVPHNEHLLVTTRLVSLLGYLFNGYWDVSFLVLAAALVRAFEVALLYRLLSRGVSVGVQRFTWLACALVFATPLSGFNLLCGLQISFYLAELALIASLFTVLHWRRGWRSGLLLMGAGAFGVLSMGSALAIPAATLITHLVTRTRRRGFWPAWAATALGSAAYIWIMSRQVDRSTAAEPLGNMAAFFLRLCSWPLMNVVLGAALLAAAAGGVVWLRRRSLLAVCPFPALAGLLAFSLTNLGLIALNRPPAEFHPRHWEMAALVPLSLLVLAIHVAAQVSRRKTALVGTSCIVVLIAGLIPRWQASWRYIADAHDDRAAALAFYRRVFTNRGDMAFEMARTYRIVASGDLTFFDDPVLRFTPYPIVYQNILEVGPRALIVLSPEILPIRNASLCARLTHLSISLGWLIALAGLAVAAATAPKGFATQSAAQPAG